MEIFPLPLSQQQPSSQQEENNGVSSLTPAQRARMAYQKEMALAKQRGRRRRLLQQQEHHRHHHHPSTQIQQGLALTLSPCSQSSIAYSQEELAVDCFTNSAADCPQSTSQQLYGTPLPLSQQRLSSQQGNSGGSSLTPAQRALMASQKEAALARRRVRLQQQQQQPTQRQRGLASTLSLCSQSAISNSDRELADDWFANSTADWSQLTSQVSQRSQKSTVLPVSDQPSPSFNQATSSFNQANPSFIRPNPNFNPRFTQPNASFSQPSPTFNPSFTQENPRFTQPNPSFNQENPNFNKAIKRPHGVINQASENFNHQAKRSCPGVFDCSSEKSGILSLRRQTGEASDGNGNYEARTGSFNPRVDVTPIPETKTYNPTLLPESGNFNSRAVLFSLQQEIGKFNPSVIFLPESGSNDSGVDVSLDSPNEDHLNEHAGGLSSCRMQQAEEDKQASSAVVNGLCHGSQYKLTSFPGQGSQAGHAHEQTSISFSEECSGINDFTIHENNQAVGKSMQGSGEADAKELSIDVSGLNCGNCQQEVMSSADANAIGFSQGESEGSNVGIHQDTRSDELTLSQGENKGSNAGFHQDASCSTGGPVSVKEQELGNADTKEQTSTENKGCNAGFHQDASCSTVLVSVKEPDTKERTSTALLMSFGGTYGSYHRNHEVVRSAFGVQGLGDEDEKRIIDLKGELQDVDKDEDKEFVPLTLGLLGLPSSLSKPQMKVLEAAATGKSIFVTGAAGTGKSYVLGFVINILKRCLGDQSVYVAASTGLAACALNGTTIHAFAGIGLGKEKKEYLASKVMRRKETMDRWRNAQALIIDEVSMIDGELFDKLDYVARVVRAESLKDGPLHKSFGGLQLIVTGDFFQLPPVKPKNPLKYFAFEADCWNKCFDLQVELEQVFRQCDGGFVGLLNKIRNGTHSLETLSLLQRCRGDLADDGLAIAPTRLYPLKCDVNQENISAMKSLERETFDFTALDWVESSDYQLMLKNMRAGKVLSLCIGAQVMLVKNLDTSSGLVNGARGVVVDFSSQLIIPDKDTKLKLATSFVSPTGIWPVVRFACDGTQRVIGPQKESIEDGGREVASRVQVPLILAWALSVHKCQGVTLDRVETDLSKAFDYGMVYVALSRVKGLNGLHLTGFDPSCIKVHPRVIQFYKKLSSEVLT